MAKSPRDGDCHVCAREDAAEINAELLMETQYSVAERFGIPRTTINRHYNNCMPGYAKETAIKLKEDRKSLHTQVQELKLTAFVVGRIDRAMKDVAYLDKCIEEAQANNDLLTAKEYFQAKRVNTDELHKWATLYAQLTGELKQDHNVTVTHDAINANLAAALDDIDRERGLEPGTTIRALLAKTNGEGATPVLGSGEEGE